MPCGTVRGDSLLFGIAQDEASLVTQSVEVTHKSDKKEARDNCGNIVSVAFYNATDDIQIEGLGTSTATPGAALSLTTTDHGTIVGDIFVDEVTITAANEEFIKTSIKATAYSGI